MKGKCLFFVLLGLSQKGFSQAENLAISDEFKDVSKFGVRQTGFEGIQTYNSGIVNGSQFFSPSWSGGTVTTTRNETFGKGYSFLFDKVRQELFMKYKDSSVILLADKSQISSFTLHTDKDHSFVASASYDPSKKGDFFEVLAKSDTGWTLLKLIRTKFVKGDERDIEKQRLGEIYDSFEDAVTYYLSYKKGLPHQIPLKEKPLLKVLDRDKTKAGIYLAAHKQDRIDEAFMRNLVEFINH